MNAIHPILNVQLRCIVTDSIGECLKYEVGDNSKDGENKGVAEKARMERARRSNMQGGGICRVK